MAKRGLGKGLDVLIGSAATAEGQRLEEIPVKDIRPNPRQPRKRFDTESLEQMTRSIEVFGVVQPIVVRTVGTDYELVAGERRWRAAQEAGLEKIPALVKQTTETDSLEMALIENLHRSDLNSIEEANAYQQLLDDFAITHEELSRRVGKSRAAISNTIRLLQLPAEIQKDVVDARIATGHARALLALHDQPALQEQIRARIVDEGLSVRQAEELCGLGAPADAQVEEEPRPEGDQKRPRGEKPPLPEEVQEMLGGLSETLDTRVKGSMGKRKGKVVIEFRNLGELRRIFQAITGREAVARKPAPAEASTDFSESGGATGPAGTRGGAPDDQPLQMGGGPGAQAPSDHWTSPPR